MIKVSIIVPVYNIKEKLFKKCIESLVSQTLEDVEIILVDDASTDEETIKLLDEYKNRFENKIVLITHDSNKRQGGARNSGLRVAKGEFVGFVDADDYIDKDMYKLLYDKAVEDGADVVDCNYTEVNQNGDFIKNVISTKDVNSAEEYLIYPGSIWSKLYSKKLIIDNELFFPENMFYEDNAVSGIHFLYANKISKVNRNLYYYVRHASSVVANQKITIDDKINAGELYISNMIQRGFFEKYKEIILARYFRIYFLNTYKFLMRYREDYSAVLKKQINNLDKYGVNFNHVLIQNQLRKKHKYQLNLLFKSPKIFKLYTDIKYWKIQKILEMVNFIFVRH